MEERTTMQRLLDRFPPWSLPLGLVLLGMLLYFGNDFLRSFATNPALAPNYQGIGIISAAVGVFIFLRQRHVF